MDKVLPVIHNVSSVQRIVDMARIVVSLGLDLLIVTKAYGAAAQSGVPEASRLLLREKKGLVVLPELKDAVEAYSPDQVILVDRDNATAHLSLDELRALRGKVMVVLNGSDAPFSPQELALGRPIYIKGLRSRAGAVAEGALVLFSLSSANAAGGQ